MKACGGSTDIVQSFLTSLLDGGEWLTSDPDHRTAGKEPWYLLSRRLDGPDNRSGGLGEEKNPFRLPGFDPWAVQAVT